MNSIRIVDERAQSLLFAQKWLLVLVALCTGIVSVWVVSTPPATGWEMMYQAYPDAFWAILSTGLIASVLVFLTSAVNGSGYWKVALVFVCLLYVLFNLLPIYRGWALYGRDSADVLLHTRYATEILRTHHNLSYNIYPILHILIVELKFLGVPIRAASSLLSAVFTPVYILGVFLLSRQLSGSHRISLVTLACAVPLLYSKFQHTIHPMIFSFFLFPFALYLAFRYKRRRDRTSLVLAVLIASLLVFFHPITSAYLIVTLTVSLAVQLLSRRLGLRRSVDYVPEVGLIAVTAATWVLWYSRFMLVQEYILTVIGVNPSSQASVATTYGTEQVARAQSIPQLAIGFVDEYGPIFFICVLASLGALVTLNRLRNGTSSFSERWLTGQFSVGVVISVVTISTYVIAYNPVRNSRYMILMAVLLSGVFLSHLLGSTSVRRERVQGAVAIAVVVLLLATIPISVTNSYQPIQHMTYSEREGTNWFYEHDDADSLAISHHVSYKMDMFLTNTTSRDVAVEDPTFEGIGEGAPMPKYFGYRSHDSVRGVVNETPTYLVTKEYDRKYIYAYEGIYRERSIVYTNETLERLREDSAVNKVYSNGGYVVWSLNHEGNSTSARTIDERSPDRPVRGSTEERVN